MKRLLLCLSLSLFFNLHLKAQVPANDLIENATEITTSDFIDENIRLDLATTTGEYMDGCAIDDFTRVYYKFTATTNGTGNFILYNQNDGSGVANGAFVLVYSAPNLNATNSDLSLVSPCVLSNSALVSVVPGQSYYVLVHRSTANVLSKFTASFSLDAPPEERQALIDLYNATDGPNWTINTNWNTDAALDTWSNVVVENGHVTGVFLQDNDLSGTLPASLTVLTELTSLYLNDNSLNGQIPNFSMLTNPETIRLHNNDFSFQDFEPNFTANSTLPDFRYSPQNRKDEVIDIETILGNDYSFSMTPVAGTNVQYQWYKGSAFSGGVSIPGENTNTLNLLNVQTEDLDGYSCSATSSLIPDLVIKRNLIDLQGPVSQLERDALIAIYNALDGPNWTGMENWNTTAPVSTWTDVTTTGNKVTRLRLGGFNPTGELPEGLGNLTNLESLFIGFFDYNLTGSLPESIGNLNNLKRLTIQANGMSGEVPESFGNLVNLEYVKFLGVGFSGALPESIGNLAQLTRLEISGFQFSGIGSDFSGTLPDSMGNLTNLQAFQISFNSFEGELPVSLSNLTNLTYFNVSDNNFYGDIPFNVPNANVYIDNNYFDFNDIEPLFQASSADTFNYAPQRTQDIMSNVETGVGADITLNVNDTNAIENQEETAMFSLYQWYKDNVEISGANNADYTIVNTQVGDSGDYHCEITNSILPDLTIVRTPITVVIDSNLSIEDTEKEGLSIYPNPTKNWLNVKTNALNDAKLSISDINGRVILTKQIEGTLNALNVEVLQSGVYILKLEHYNSVYTKRFIKQ